MTLALSCIKKLSALLRGITSKNIIVWIFFILLEQKNKLESHKSVCESKDVIMPSEDTTILNLINIKNLIKHHLIFMQIMNV